VGFGVVIVVVTDVDAVADVVDVVGKRNNLG